MLSWSVCTAVSTACVRWSSFEGGTGSTVSEVALSGACSAGLDGIDILGIAGTIGIESCGLWPCSEAAAFWRRGSTGVAAGDGVVGWVESVSDGACEDNGVSSAGGAGRMSLFWRPFGGADTRSIAAFSELGGISFSGGNSTGALEDCARGGFRRLRGALGAYESSGKSHGNYLVSTSDSRPLPSRDLQEGRRACTEAVEMDSLEVGGGSIDFSERKQEHSTKH